jgi:hypothetical protein
MKKFFHFSFKIYMIYNNYNIMAIKPLQTLVSEAMQEIKTINADEALKMVEENNVI